MTVTVAHLTPIVALHRRHPDPHHAAAAQLHRRDLPDRHRPRRAQRHSSLHPLTPAPPFRALASSCAAVIIRGRAQSTSVVPWSKQARAVLDRRRNPPAPAPARKAAAAPQGCRRTQGREGVRQNDQSRQSGQGRPRRRWVYSFGDGKAEGRADMRNLLGGKGAGLAEMANLGLPVPPGFTITTEVCTQFYANDKPIRTSCTRRSTPRLRRSAASPARPSATAAIRCWSRCARARAPPCRA